MGGTAVVLAFAVTATAGQAQIRTFNIPPQAAVSAIPEFARQGQVQIIAPARDLKNARTPEIKGEMDVHAALRKLLADIPLHIASDDGQIITLRSGGTPNE